MMKDAKMHMRTVLTWFTETFCLLSPRISIRVMQAAAREAWESVAGEPALRHAYDDVVDGLAALIAPDSNILEIEWTRDYQGRLRVTFGTQELSDDYAISPSLRFGSTTFRF